MTPADHKAPLPDVIAYLLGEGPLDGCHYPDFPDNGEKYKRRYWWRSALRAHIAALEAENKRLQETIEAAKHLSMCLEKTNWSSWQSTSSFSDAHNTLDNKLAALAQSDGKAGEP